MLKGQCPLSRGGSAPISDPSETLFLHPEQAVSAKMTQRIVPQFLHERFVTAGFALSPVKYPIFTAAFHTTTKNPIAIPNMFCYNADDAGFSITSAIILTKQCCAVCHELPRSIVFSCKIKTYPVKKQTTSLRNIDFLRCLC